LQYEKDDRFYMQYAAVLYSKWSDPGTSGIETRGESMYYLFSLLGDGACKIFSLWTTLPLFSGMEAVAARKNIQDGCLI
jgi:hypothetical protein